MADRTKKVVLFFLTVIIIFSCAGPVRASAARQEKKAKELETLQKRFEWWPTDARPGPVKDAQRGGYWGRQSRER